MSRLLILAAIALLVWLSLRHFAAKRAATRKTDNLDALRRCEHCNVYLPTDQVCTDETRDQCPNKPEQD